LLTDYPFGILAKEEFDIKQAKRILEEDHYGMDKLKQRILEFIAVSKLKG
jgi:ATP-dependent Lon protease